MKKYRLFALVLVVSIMTTLLLPFQSLALEPPEFHGKNAILVDANYDEVLYEVGGHDKVYPASITKVMSRASLPPRPRSQPLPRPPLSPRAALRPILRLERC